MSRISGSSLIRQQGGNLYNIYTEEMACSFPLLFSIEYGGGGGRFSIYKPAHKISLQLLLLFCAGVV